MINKKASMELGISTVVVLVIAMVIIAGGIAFIRGFFSKGTEKLGSAFNVGDFGVQPTSIDPLVLVEGSPTIKGGDTVGVKVGYYNGGTADATATIVFGECASTVDNAGCTAVQPIVKSLKQTVKPGESAGFETFVTASCVSGNGKKNLLSGEYICQLKAVDGTTVLAETQITFTVTG